MEIGPDIYPHLGESYDDIEKTVIEYYANDANKDVEWFWMGNTTETTARLARALIKHGPENVKIMSNVWGFDENAYGICAEGLAEGEENPCVNKLYGVMPFAAYGDQRNDGMPKVVEIHDKHRKANNEDLSLYADVRYVQGYVTFLIWKIAVERVIDANLEITGSNIKDELEKFKKVSTDGLTAPITITPADHRPTSGATIYTINKYGLLEYKAEADIELKNEWLGW